MTATLATRSRLQALISALYPGGLWDFFSYCFREATSLATINALAEAIKEHHAGLDIWTWPSTVDLLGHALKSSQHAALALELLALPRAVQALPR